MSAFTPEQQSELSNLIGRETERLDMLVRQLQGAVVIAGSGSPAGVLAAPLGSVYRNLSGGATATLWVKESGGSTSAGWVAK